MEDYLLKVYLIDRVNQCPMTVFGPDLGADQHTVQMTAHKANMWAKAKSVPVPRLCPDVGTCPHYSGVIEQVVGSLLLWLNAHSDLSDWVQLLVHYLGILIRSTE